MYHQAVLGTILGYVYCLLVCLGDGNLVPCIILHCLNNLSAACFFTPPIKDGSGASQPILKNESIGKELSQEEGMLPHEFPISFVPIEAGKLHGLRDQSDGRAADVAVATTGYCDGFGLEDNRLEALVGDKQASGFPHFSSVDPEMALLVLRVIFACGSMTVAIALCLRVGRLPKR